MTLMRRISVATHFFVPLCASVCHDRIISEIHPVRAIVFEPEGRDIILIFNKEDLGLRSEGGRMKAGLTGITNKLGLSQIPNRSES